MTNDKRAAAAVGAWLLVITVLDGFFLLGVWSALSDIGSASDASVLIGFPFSWAWRFEASSAELTLLVAGSAGMIGSLVYASRGYAVHVANNRFGSRWSVWYVVRPFVGAVLGAATAAAFSAGLISGGLESGDARPVGILIIGFIAGMFAKQTVDKFEELIDVLFGRPQSDVERVEAKIAAVRTMESKGQIGAAEATAKVDELLKRI